MPIVDGNYLNAAIADLPAKRVWQDYLATQDGLTANAGGGQANATQITSMTSRVTTVASIGDSVGLPKSSPGLFLTVVNAGANSMNVFPASGENINSLGANTALAVAAGKACLFIATSKGQWHSVLTA